MRLCYELPGTSSWRDADACTSYVQGVFYTLLKGLIPPTFVQHLWLPLLMSDNR